MGLHFSTSIKYSHLHSNKMYKRRNLHSASCIRKDCPFQCSSVFCYFTWENIIPSCWLSCFILDPPTYFLIINSCMKKNVKLLFFSWFVLLDMRRSLCFRNYYADNQTCDGELLYNMTKKMCCCSYNIGRAWNRPCEECPLPSTGEYGELLWCLLLLYLHKLPFCTCFAWEHIINYGLEM